MSLEIIKELREETGLSFSEIKKAFQLAGGDKAKTLEALAERAREMANQKSERKLEAGVIAVYRHHTGTAAAMVELSCETDFVSQNAEFINLANEIAFQVVALNPTSLNNEDGAGEELALLKQAFIKDPSLSMEQKIQKAIQKFGENIAVKRFVRYSV